MDGMSMERRNMHACLFVVYCNGYIGVPITFLDKYCPEQFNIIGCFNNYKPETADPSFAIYGEAVSVPTTQSLFRGPVINGFAKYFRILISNKELL